MNTTPNSKPTIYVQTPLIESIPLQEFVPKQRKIFLKLENTQPSGSFKMRGVSELCRHAKASGFTTMVCASSGNAGLATAFSARALGLRCHILVFKAIPEEVRRKIRAYGASVEEHGTVWDDTYQYAVKLTSGSRENFLVHPFNHPILWKGHSTMVEEIKEDLAGEVPSLIVTVCGGGGLASGLVEGVRAVGWAQRTKLLVMETTGAASFNACARAGAGVKARLEAVNSIASSLITKEVCDQIVADYARNEPSLLSRTVSDGQVVQACIRFANDHRFIVGPACGAALAAVYGGVVKEVLEGSDVKEFDLHLREDKTDGPIVVIVCGGAEVTFDLLKEWSEKEWEN